VDEIKAADTRLGAKAEEQLLRPIRVAPTLVKYVNSSEYEIKTRQELAQAAAQLMHGVPVGQAPMVDLVESGPLEVELAATLIYSACHHPFRQVRERVQGLTGAQRDEIIDLGLRRRGRHDELLRLFHAGQQFCFDILMDIGGFRDLHRHRRCTQIEQGFTHQHGYETPPDLVAAGLQGRYNAAMRRVRRAQAEIETHADAADPGASLYLLPLAFRKRTLFKMDFAEALYIAELRSAPAGHFSYRNVAHAMYDEVARKHPSLARHFRMSGPVTSDRPEDLLKR
jgi:hypothetical protein